MSKSPLRLTLAMGGLTALLLPSCHHTVIAPESNVVVKQVQIPAGMPWYSRFAVHSYLDYRPSENQAWRRIEIVNKDSGIKHYEIPLEEVHHSTRWNEPVRIVSQSQEDAPQLAREVATFAKNYPDANRYQAWPGPNSNTFLEKLLLETNLPAQLDHNAVGKNYGWYAGPSTSGRGLKLQAPYLGLTLGLEEGLEVHFIGLTTGIGLWPPSLKIPFIPPLLRQPALHPLTQAPTLAGPPYFPDSNHPANHQAPRPQE